MEQKELKFPNGFLWGVATSAYQIEGGIHNDWSEWEQQVVQLKKKNAKNAEEIREIEDNYLSGLASDSYHRWREDIELVKELNCKVFRFSIEWSRVEPEEGKFNQEALNHYAELIKELRKNKIEPFVNIWHWTLPVWLRDIGGWENKQTIKYFLCLVDKLVETFGKDVKFWMTMNEPETYIGLSYVSGKFPPQVKSLWRANKVFNNLIKAHIESYKLIHERLGNEVKVSLTHYVIYQSPLKNSLLNKMVVSILDYFRWARFLKKTQKYEDYIGLQYYHHDRIKLKLGGKYYLADVQNENKWVNDLGWEIYPEGIYRLLKKMKRFNKPIYITENGTADANDDLRPRFIVEHLKFVHKAIEEGVDVRGYLHWSLIDNFEWADGHGPKFGLYQVDRKTFKRTARGSAKLYSEICKNNSIKI